MSVTGPRKKANKSQNVDKEIIRVMEKSSPSKRSKIVVLIMSYFSGSPFYTTQILKAKKIPHGEIVLSTAYLYFHSGAFKNLKNNTQEK